MNPDGDLEVLSLSLLAPCPQESVPLERYPSEYAGGPPMQVLYGSKDQDGCVALGQAIAIYEPTARLRHYAHVVGASHQGFTDDGPLAAATISRTDHHRAAESAMVAWHAHFLNGDPRALAFLRGDRAFLRDGPEVRYQSHDPARLVIDDFEGEATKVPSVAIAGIPGRTFVNGFLSDTFVDFEVGVRIVRAQLARLLPSAGGPYRVLFFEDAILGPSVYAEALSRERSAGRISETVFTRSHATFAGQIPQEPPWDLVLCANQGGSRSAVHPFDAPLRDWVCGGGKAILSDFRVDSPTADVTLRCSDTDFDSSTNWVTMTVPSHPGIEPQLTNPGWGIATYGLRTDATAFATNEFLVPSSSGDPTTNSLGLPVSAPEVETFEEVFAHAPARTLFHPTGALEIAWTESGGRLVQTLAHPASAPLDASGWGALSFRLVQLIDDPLNPGTSKDFTVRLTDRDGESSSVELGEALQGPLRYPPLPAPGIGRKSIFETYRLPLATFQRRNPRLDRTRLQRLEFLFERSPTGRVLLDDIELVPRAPIDVPAR